MDRAARHDVFTTGDPYERYVGRWSRKVAPEFLAWLAMPPQLDWLDVGCGTGALSQTILDKTVPKSVKGIDASPGFVEYARTNIRDPRASFAVGDARSIPVDDASVDTAVSGLVMNFVPEPVRMAADMARAARPGGTVAVYVWDYSGQMAMMRVFWSTATELDPNAADEGPRFALCHPDALEAVFAEAGLAQVEVRPIDIPTVFRSFDDYWSPFLGGQGPGPAYVMSLDPERRNALRDRIRSKLREEPDGSIHLTARAWAVRGRKG
ncbi:MAG TPA: methyltransferase domain-containing protein [Candidatus Eisenbacteria bacterium]|nr:methyltransferase domain-containing protein [Candidatus Eisenbacteria bacterium]